MEKVPKQHFHIIFIRKCRFGILIINSIIKTLRKLFFNIIFNKKHFAIFFLLF
jgi:hypothetical protein